MNYHMIPSFVFKHRAWAAIKPWLQVLVVVGLLVTLPGLLNETATLLLQDDMEQNVIHPAEDVLNYLVQPLPEGVTEENITPEQRQEMVDGLQLQLDAFATSAVNFMQEKGWILLTVGALELVLTPVFMAPLFGALLDAYRGKELTLPGALAKLRRGPKMLLLQLWTALRIWVWMLPGMAVMVAGSFLPGIGQVLVFAGFTVSMVLCIRAVLHYALAPIALMDRPEMSVNGCIRASWQVMHTRKLEYFMLRISFVGWQLLVSLISMLAGNTVMTVICLTLTMAANMLLTLYINGSVVAFWDAYGVQHEHADPNAYDRQAPSQGDELN